MCRVYEFRIQNAEFKGGTIPVKFWHWSLTLLMFPCRLHTPVLPTHGLIKLLSVRCHQGRMQQEYDPGGTDQVKSGSFCYPVLPFSRTGKLLWKIYFPNNKNQISWIQILPISVAGVFVHQERTDWGKKLWKAIFPPIRKVSVGISCHLYIFTRFCSAILNKMCNKTPGTLCTVPFLIARLLPVLS